MSQSTYLFSFLRLFRFLHSVISRHKTFIVCDEILQAIAAKSYHFVRQYLTYVHACRPGLGTLATTMFSSNSSHAVGSASFRLVGENILESVATFKSSALCLIGETSFQKSVLKDKNKRMAAHWDNLYRIHCTSHQVFVTKGISKAQKSDSPPILYCDDSILASIIGVTLLNASPLLHVTALAAATANAWRPLQRPRVTLSSPELIALSLPLIKIG